jgi:hypothetical protein
MGKPLFVETQEAALWDDNKPQSLSFTVDGAKETDTGLIERNLHSIYRLQDPIGFGRH